MLRKAIRNNKKLSLPITMMMTIRIKMMMIKSRSIDRHVKNVRKFLRMKNNRINAKNVEKSSKLREMIKMMIKIILKRNPNHIAKTKKMMIMMIKIQIKNQARASIKRK